MSSWARALRACAPPEKPVHCKERKAGSGEDPAQQTYIHKWKKRSKGLGEENRKGKLTAGLAEHWRCALHARSSRQVGDHPYSHQKATEAKAIPLVTPKLTLTSGRSLYKPDRLTLKTSITLTLYLQLLGLKLKGRHDRPSSLRVEGRVFPTAAPGQQRGLGEGLAAPPVGTRPSCTGPLSAVLLNETRLLSHPNTYSKPTAKNTADVCHSSQGCQPVTLERKMSPKYSVSVSSLFWGWTGMPGILYQLPLSACWTQMDWREVFAQVFVLHC